MIVPQCISISKGRIHLTEFLLWRMWYSSAHGWFCESATKLAGAITRHENKSPLGSRLDDSYRNLVARSHRRDHSCLGGCLRS